MKMSQSQRRYDEALRTFSYFIDNLEIEVMLVDAELNIEWLNQMARNHVGKSANAIGRRWHWHLMQDPPEQPCGHCQKILRESTPVSGILKQGNDVFVQYTSIPLALPIWDAPKYLIALTDVSDSEAELRQLQAENQRMHKLADLGELVAKLAHEIRNPLVSMGGLARAIAEQSPAEGKVRAFAETIYAHALQLENILENVLFQTSQGRLDITDVCLYEVIENTIMGIRMTPECDGCAIHVEVPKNLTVSADASRLRQVFTNIIRNSLQAMPFGGQVEIFSKLDDGEGLRLHICDNGTGINSNDAEHLFEPFYTTKAGGSGLGLHISRQIMQQHGGDIRLSCNADAGTDVILLFPQHTIQHEGRNPWSLKTKP
jgi:signal transduction histidine kinase